MRINIQALMMSVLFCFAVSGCGIVGLSQNPNKTDDWELLDPNDHGIERLEGEDEGVTFDWKWKADIVENDNYIDYWRLKHAFRGYPIVKGELNDKVYPMLFDTGFCTHFFVQNIHITENDLPVFFFNPEKKKDGLAIAKEIKSGSLIFKNVPCFFSDQSPQWTLLGIPIARERHFIVGLPLISSFKYCKFDQVKKQIQLSLRKAFSPENEEEWIIYPFELKGSRLLLNISVEGVDTILMLDTGACLELQLFESVTEKLYEKREDYRKAWKAKKTIFMPHIDRVIKALKFDAKDCKLGEHVLDKVKIYSCPVRVDDKYDGMVGMKLFKKTAMVLDFDKNLMWVKKTKGSLFDF